MRLLIAVGLLAAGYVYMLLHTTDTTVVQLQQMQSAYSNVEQQADAISGTYNTSN